MPPSLRRAALLVVLAATSCRTGAVPSVVRPPAPPPTPHPEVLDALGAADRAWAYLDARRARTDLLPEVARAVESLRADVQVGHAAALVSCGFDPVLSFDELLVRVRWDTTEPRPPWTAVVRVTPPLDAAVRCLRSVVSGVVEVSLDGHPAWQMHRAIVVWNDGVFVVASSPPEAHSLLARMAHPEAAALALRNGLAGTIFSAHAAAPDPFGMEALEIRYVPRPPGTELDLSARFQRESGARQAETIVGDGLTQLLGPVALDPEPQRRAEDLVRTATVKRDGQTLAVRLEVPSLAGQTALVSRITTGIVRGVKLYSSWDLAAEARDMVFAVARGLVDFANRRREEGKSPRFPPSAPLVPDHIPEGKRVTPNPHAFLHPSWQDIHYSSDAPTFYAIEYVTAKDGKSAVVRARGDIDGNDITSLFELDVKLDAHGRPLVAPAMRERDPGE